MPRIPADDLTAFARRLLTAAGMEDDLARVTAEVLVEGDMIGHDTHGVGLLPWYVAEIEAGHLATAGRPEVVTDRGATFVWDGRRLPGAWLLRAALAQAADRAATCGVVTAALRNCHHTCALSAFLRPLTERGLVVQLSVSNPAAQRVAPFGGTRPLLTPNPLAAGFPTSGDPILVDVSTSITTTTLTQTLAREGGRFPEPWVLTADGMPSDDPREVTERGGTIMPLGGALKGHKGYGLALMVELLGQGLSGKGRADTPAPGPLAQSAFLQVIDPAFFAGAEAFRAQSDHLARACRANPAVDPARPVRVPGDSAARHRRDASTAGVPVADPLWDQLTALLRRLEAAPGEGGAA
jgi:LDH2 family malate/lactate/ureidoglycolate dehydrogenase